MIVSKDGATELTGDKFEIAADICVACKALKQAMVDRGESEYVANELLEGIISSIRTAVIKKRY